MEDDAGKSVHDGFKDSDRYSYVDLNRSGTPLIEIVSEPDMRSSDEAYAFLTELKQVLQYIAVSTCDMEKGHLRCDANVSVRLRGAEKFGTKAEVKNLNSFRFLKLALDHEIARQVALIEGGGRVVQETRLYNADTGETGEHAQQGTRARLSLLPGTRPWSPCEWARHGWVASARRCRSFRRPGARASSKNMACANTTLKS
jgi:Asp-tRNA(Asn)/Glu-tRNA(Gln) amidotransferase B subunit